MTLLSLKHVTHYRYAQPVARGEHRIMVRPREAYDQHLYDAALVITPVPADLRWVQDVFGNAVAIASFAGRSRELRLDSSCPDQAGFIDAARSIGREQGLDGLLNHAFKNPELLRERQSGDEISGQLRAFCDALLEFF